MKTNPALKRQYPKEESGSDGEDNDIVTSKPKTENDAKKRKIIRQQHSQLQQSNDRAFGHNQQLTVEQAANANINSNNNPESIPHHLKRQSQPS